MKTNLSQLYRDIARADAPRGYNASIRETEVAISELGRHLRAVWPWRALRILLAIYRRAGRT